MTSVDASRTTGTDPARTRRLTSFLLAAYLCLTPWVVIPTDFGFSLGASDLLFPVAIVAVARRMPLRGGAPAFILVTFFGASYLATLLLGSVTGSLPMERVLTLTRAVAVLFPFLVAIAHGRPTGGEMRRILTLLVWSTLLAMSTGWVLFRLGIKIRDSQQTIWSGSGEVTLRAGGLLGNSTSFGSLAVALAAAVLVFVVLTKWRMALSVLAVVGALSAILIASSRASLLNLAVVLVLLTPVLFRRRGLLGVVTALALAALILLLGASASNFASSSTANTVLYRLDFLNLSGHSTFYQSSTRLDSWDAMGQLFRSNWLLGTGYDSIVGVVGNAGDNAFLSLFVELGFAAGALFVLFWVALLVMFLRSSEKNVRWLGVAVVTGMIVQMFTVDSYREWPSMPIVMVIVGILCVLSQPSKMSVDGYTEAERTFAFV